MTAETRLSPSKRRQSNAVTSWPPRPHSIKWASQKSTARQKQELFLEVIIYFRSLWSRAVKLILWTGLPSLLFASFAVMFSLFWFSFKRQFSGHWANKLKIFCPENVKRVVKGQYRTEYYCRRWLLTFAELCIFLGLCFPTPAATHYFFS